MTRLTGHLLLAAVLLTVCCAERQALPESQRLGDHRTTAADGERTIVRRQVERRHQTVPAARTRATLWVPVVARIAPPRPLPTSVLSAGFVLGFDELRLPPPTA